MRCFLCKATRILRFIDGFGDKRIFCRGCGRSFIEQVFENWNGQKNLQDFKVGSFYRNLPAPEH